MSDLSGSSKSWSSVSESSSSSSLSHPAYGCTPCIGGIVPYSWRVSFNLVDYCGWWQREHGCREWFNEVELVVPCIDSDLDLSNLQRAWNYRLDFSTIRGCNAYEDGLPPNAYVGIMLNCQGAPTVLMQIEAGLRDICNQYRRAWINAMPLPDGTDCLKYFNQTVPFQNIPYGSCIFNGGSITLGAIQ